jgi:hypothetical protein
MIGHITPCAALSQGQQGDLFADRHYSADQRPWVPSDQAKGQDLFRADSFAFSPQAEAFQHRRRNYQYGPQDMFNSLAKAPYPYQSIFQSPP